MAVLHPQVFFELLSLAVPLCRYNPCLSQRRMGHVQVCKHRALQDGDSGGLGAARLMLLVLDLDNKQKKIGRDESFKG